MSKHSELLQRFELEVGDGKYAKKTLKALARCEDVMPAILCSDLDLPSGATYRRGVVSILEAEFEAQIIRQFDEITDRRIDQMFRKTKKS
jgi:hypothetical protein